MQLTDNLIPHIHDAFWLSWDDEQSEFKTQKSRKHLHNDDDGDDVMSDSYDSDTDDHANISSESAQTVHGRDIEGNPSSPTTR
jgi:hypothetical protein